MNNQPPAPFQDPGFQMGSPMEANAGAPAPKFRLKKFLISLRKFWWIPLITLMIAVGWAAIKFRVAPPIFVSSASMWQSEKLELPQGANFSEDSDTFFGNLTAVLQSDTLRQLALARLAAAGTNNIVTDKDGNPIGVQISVFSAPKSTVFNIQAISSNPSFSSLFLNALIGSYLDYRKNTRKEVSGDTLASISAQVTQLEEEMTSDQAVLAQYEKTNNFVVLEQENQVAGSYLAKLKTQLADYQLQSNLLNAVALEKSSPLLLGTTNASTSLYDQLLGGNNSGSTPASAIEDTDQQIASLKFQRDKLSKYLRPEHPKIVQLNEQIAQAENLAEMYRKENQQDIATARQALKIRIDSVQQAINEWETKVNEDSARIAEAENLKANITRNQSLYDQLVSLLHNVDITRNIDQETLAILQPASPATRSYQELKSSISAAVFGGLAVGLGLVLLITIRDDRFASIVEVTERFGDNVVGQVPEIPEPSRSPLVLLENNDDQHMYVESYRSLRSALLFFSINGARPKLVLITSAVPNEGKSTIASNLAFTLALGGARVLLMDADLRKGRLHDILGVPSNPGLAELLLQPGDLDKFILATPMSNLSFIPRGRGQRNPGDLFLSPVFDDILARLRERYDYVIIDSCPVFAADDATTLAPKVDGTLFVVRSRFSRANIVKEALEMLYQRQANILGLILNRTDATDRSYHYYKYSEYHTSDK
ncbi:MAG TPA: polysaccharide biosynthesis tyrosine autokinase [Verrucomicrobiae bacterium]|jgi:capsular exopolysaccharide synthesis family protein